MANVYVRAEVILPLGGTPQEGWKLGYVDSADKAAQSDTWTVTNAAEISVAFIGDDSTGILDVCTIATNVITMTNASTGAATGLIIYR